MYTISRIEKNSNEHLQLKIDLTDEEILFIYDLPEPCKLRNMKCLVTENLIPILSVRLDMNFDLKNFTYEIIRQG